MRELKLQESNAYYSDNDILKHLNNAFFINAETFSKIVQICKHVTKVLKLFLFFNTYLALAGPPVYSPHYLIWTLPR